MNKCITTIYYLIDNFCTEYNKWEQGNILPSEHSSSSIRRNREGKLSLSELITIVLYYYLSPCKDFKNYYLYHVQSKYRGYFEYVSYSRIIQLMPRLILPISIIMQMLSGEKTGEYYIDSTKLQICHNKRTNSNKVFKKIAKIGRSSYGWFMGFKLHLIINKKGEIMAVKITKGNKSDVSVLPNLASNLTGTIYGDKGYISKNLFAELYAKGLRVITTIRKDMKNHLLSAYDKMMLRKRSLIESVFNVLKNSMELEHSRHRSPINFLLHIIACLTGFAINKLINKPNIMANISNVLS